MVSGIYGSTSQVWTQHWIFKRHSIRQLSISLQFSVSWSPLLAVEARSVAGVEPWWLLLLVSSPGSRRGSYWRLGRDQMMYRAWSRRNSSHVISDLRNGRRHRFPPFISCSLFELDCSEKLMQILKWGLYTSQQHLSNIQWLVPFQFTRDALYQASHFSSFHYLSPARRSPAPTAIPKENLRGECTYPGMMATPRRWLSGCFSPYAHFS